MKRTRPGNDRRYTLTPPLSNPFSEFYLALNIEQREEFAAEVGTSERYLTYKVITGERMPSREMIVAIEKASAKFRREFSRTELFAFFDAAFDKVRKARGRTRRRERATA